MFSLLYQCLVTQQTRHPMLTLPFVQHQLHRRTHLVVLLGRVQEQALVLVPVRVPAPELALVPVKALARVILRRLGSALELHPERGLYLWQLALV